MKSPTNFSHLIDAIRRLSGARAHRLPASSPAKEPPPALAAWRSTLPPHGDGSVTAANCTVARSVQKG